MQPTTTTPSTVKAIAGPSALPFGASSSSRLRSAVDEPRCVSSDVARPTRPYNIAARIGIVSSPMATSVRRFTRGVASRGGSTVLRAGVSRAGVTGSLP